ncbi:MAG: helix-turn-helix transcriptional regulator [Clostridia bacterium]|nr:helix-turn-helix transcriptional regulator [Clostridia bacterium]
MVSYKKLFKLLIDKDMSKKDLAEKAGLSAYTVTKMNKGEIVKSDTLAKICKVLNCTFDDIMEITQD